MEWAINRYGNDARVVGAVMSLGHCLNLTDYRSTKILRKGYEVLCSYCNNLGLPMPENKKGRSDTDLLLRNLDCAVIEQVHGICQMISPEARYDSVRGVFLEGGEAYPGAGISEKTHVQICIVNPNCIKGYFSPIEPENGYSVP